MPGYDSGNQDRSRVQHGLSHGHGVKPVGGNERDHFGVDQKSLIHELEDESDSNPMYTSCKYNCGGDQFHCISTCDCIDMFLRCDGSVSLIIKKTILKSKKVLEYFVV